MTRPEAISLARDKYGRWTAPQIRKYLARHGINVSERTIRRWATEEDVTEQNRRDVERKRDARVLTRIRTLREHRVSVNAIATVLSLDFDCHVSGDQVRWCLTSGRMNEGLREMLWPYPGRRPKEFVPGALCTADRRVESRPESKRGEQQSVGRDARLPTPSPFEGVS